VLDKLQIIGGAFTGIFGTIPLNAAAYNDARMKDVVKTAYEKHQPDLIFTYRLRMAQYAAVYTVPKVIDYVDSLAPFMKRSAGFEVSIFKKLYYLFDGPRVENYERSVAADFKSVFINSEEDAQYLGNKNIITAANGAMKAGKPAKAGGNGAYTVGFMGNMPYGPNREAVRWFIKNVWKKTFNNDKNIRLVIAGRGADVFSELAGGNIELRDNVKDVEKEITSWDLSVVPVRYGAGRQNKVMDCWACSVPVIAAPFAAKGVYGKDGVNMMIAGNREEFAKKIILLRDKPAIGRKLAANAKITLNKYFDWDKTGRIINKAILKAAK
jgi:glycosyltransferase involved in cell wall biosynthesis